MGNTCRKHMGYILKFTEDDGTPYTTITAKNKNELIDELIFMLMNTASLYLTEDSDFA